MSTKEEEELLAKAGLKRDDFAGFLTAYESQQTGRIVVFCRDPLSGESLKIPTPPNLFRQSHVNETGDGTTLYYFEVVKAN